MEITLRKLIVVIPQINTEKAKFGYTTAPTWSMSYVKHRATTVGSAMKSAAQESYQEYRPSLDVVHDYWNSNITKTILKPIRGSPQVKPGYITQPIYTV